MDEAELAACAREAFDVVAKEVEGEMGRPSVQERATICRRLVPVLREGSKDPRVAGLPHERRRRVVVNAGKILVRRLIESSCAN